ncbi:Hypothetical protein P9303_13131 [Prochlorococcus marinus str. MIT 9303]|uniref:Uncharacterized protein n=1 Tax=Prochlorococcus marinus (strain MIT 9303) TaxID=59922 RepID=A2C9A0_PROM3|nr:Hypothetical protein P9303_13131 [Prochlorococcus marinus str. MIT 9303]
MPWAWNFHRNQMPEDWHLIAVRFRKANGIRDSDRERCLCWLL